MRSSNQLAAYYRELGDDALAAAYAQGPDAYEINAWRIIVAEVGSRNLALAPPLLRPTESDEHRSGDSNADEPAQREYWTAQLEEAERMSQWGTGYVVVGLLVTFGSYFVVSQSGGYYFVAWGAVVVGVIRIWRAARLQSRAAKSLQAIEQSTSMSGP